MRPITLSKVEIESAESLLPTGFFQGQEMLRYLAKHPNASTKEINSHCDIDNLSYIARKSNKFLAAQNLFISCQKSPDSESSRMYQWGIYRTDQVAYKQDKVDY